MARDMSDIDPAMAHFPSRHRLAGHKRGQWRVDEPVGDDGAQQKDDDGEWHESQKTEPLPA